MSKKIMFVDDEEDTRITLKELLENHNFKAIACKNGKEALKKLSKDKPNLILMDINMPSMNGWQVVSKIRSNPKTKDIPIVFLTGQLDEMSKSMGLQGAEGYITKPFDTYELIRKIKRFLE